MPGVQKVICADFVLRFSVLFRPTVQNFLDAGVAGSRGHRDSAKICELPATATSAAADEWVPDF